MERQCRATNAAGGPCQAKPVRESGYCWVHDGAVADQRQAWRREGGRQRSNAARARKQLPTETLGADELIAHLSSVFMGVVDGTVEPRVGTAAASIAKTLIDIRGAGEVERLAEELAELRALVARRPA